MGKILEYRGISILMLRKLDNEFDKVMSLYERLLTKNAAENRWDRYPTIVIYRIRYLEKYFSENRLILLSEEMYKPAKRKEKRKIKK